MSKSVQFDRKPVSFGGPSNFQYRLIKYLKQIKYSVSFANDRTKPDILFIISGTKNYLWIFKNKFNGIKIIQRLDGYLWKHQHEKSSIWYRVKCEFINLNMMLIRKYLADHVVYQSQYIKNQWNKKFGVVNSNYSIIHNSAGMEFFKNKRKSDTELFKIVCVEGMIQDDNVTIEIIKNLNEVVENNKMINCVDIYGEDKLIKSKVNNLKNVNFKGYISSSSLSKIYDQSNLIFFILEINPPCPNSLIESICAGVPSIGFNTGSYKELSKGTGIAIDYVNNQDKLEVPDFSLFAKSFSMMIENYETFLDQCSKIAEKYKIERMGNEYLKIINLLA